MIGWQHFICPSIHSRHNAKLHQQEQQQRQLSAPNVNSKRQGGMRPSIDDGANQQHVK
jgi:hypothetical protein